MTNPVPLFPTDDKLRKMLPVFKQLTRYFPRAFRELTKVSVVNNVRYNPDREPNDINWARGKSPHQMDSALKHMMEHADGKVFDDVDPKVADVTGIKRIYILAQAMWRISAELELLIEKTEAAELQAPQPSPLTGEGKTVLCACGTRQFTGVREGELLPTVTDSQGRTHGVPCCLNKAGEVFTSPPKGKPPFDTSKMTDDGFYTVDSVRTAAMQETQGSSLVFCWRPGCEGHQINTGTCDV